MQIEIVGQDAVQATEELLEIDGIEGNYEILNAVQREGTLATIATIVGIVSGSLTVAEKLYELNKKYQNSLNPTGVRIEKIMIVNGDNRLLLKDATVEQIKDILES
jgi:hypothetical protein